MTKKNRGRNEGSVFQLSNKHWRAQVYQSGKRQSKNFQTKEEALIWLRTTKTNIDRGYDILKGNMTLGAYLDSWLEKKQIELREQTAHSYRQAIKNHIAPSLGKEQLRDIKLVTIEGFYSKLLQNGIGTRTIRIIHNILHSSLAKAVRYGFIFYNPTQGASLPRYSHKKMTALDASQALHFILTAKTCKHYALFYLAVKTGMRIGELLGLEWSDILWNEGAIHIQQQKQDVPGKGSVFIEPKTNAGRRTIRIGEETLSLLRKHKEEQSLQKTYVGARWREMNLVFPNSIGGPGVSSNIRKEFNYVLEQAGLPRIRFHDLRHTAASILLNNNIPVNVVSGILGHSKPSVTLDIYAHMFHDQQEEAATLMDKLLTPIPIEIFAPVDKPSTNP